ncbi:ATP-binding protein [Sphaerisporangium rubeum]|uniref:ATPase AAA-type core domain-containing protein n=1 Tax=Sphaerisporangium rubeum TaxID=321317 RepID=A0A7X0M406_9ACTN|nr:ATP-binding protein [Sphaerisporangium rubeum]MBB6471198.1 hypothetical protein [Sphaerisporangium rubeum]
MLIRFAVSNFRSILDPVELSMVAIDRDRPAARPMAHLGESLLPIAAIYGPNASGKSNVLDALSWLVAGIELSHRYWDDEIPVEPFAFSRGQERTTEFTIDAAISGIRHEYTVTLDRHAIHHEALFHYPKKKRRLVFERTGSAIKFQRGFGNLSGVRGLLSTRTLALSAARRFDDPLISDFTHELLNIQGLWAQLVSARRGTFTPDHIEHATRNLFAGLFTDNQTTISNVERARRSQAMALLRLADLGITGVAVGPLHLGFPRDIRLLHQAEGEEDVELDFHMESEGTQRWYYLIGPILNALRTGSLLLFDELDASLHPTLCTELIRLFHEPSTNPKGAQLIFSSHDTSLLNHLNRDEVWLTEKGPDGTTRLGALADFAGERVRRSQNLEKAYLQGRFGALPEVDRAEFLRALGLIG